MPSRNIIKFLSSLSTVELSFFSFSCAPTLVTSAFQTNSDEPTHIKIFGPSTLHFNESQIYKVVCFPESLEKNIIWSVNDENLATISDDGVLTAKNTEGKIKVIATSSSDQRNKTYKEIQILKPFPTSITIEGPSSLHLEQTHKYSITTEPKVALDDVKWSVEPHSNAEVSSDGTLTPLKEGVVTLKASSKYDAGVSSTLDITIEPILPDSIKVIGATMIPEEYESVQYQVKTEPVGSFDHVIWSVDDSSYGVIDADGKFVLNKSEGLGKRGTFHIIATSTEKPSVYGQLEVHIDDYCDVVVAETVGTAFTYTKSQEMAEREKDFEINFESTLFPYLVKLPTHEELKKTDLEVVKNKTNYIDSCYLVNNTLKIPHSVIGNADSIEIRILGARIADWVSWELIQQMSLEDDETDEDFAKKYFQVGDYKLATYCVDEEKKEYVSIDTRLIGMEEAQVLINTEEGPKLKIAPFTFEFTSPLFEEKWDITWSNKGDYYGELYSCGWADIADSEVGDKVCGTCRAARYVSTSVDECITPTYVGAKWIIDINYDPKDKYVAMNYFSLSATEMGSNTPSDKRQIKDQIEGKVFSYYSDNYKTLISKEERRKKTNMNDKSEIVNYYTRSFFFTYVWNADVSQYWLASSGYGCYVNKDNGKIEGDHVGSISDYPKRWVGIAFSI